MYIYIYIYIYIYKYIYIYIKKNTHTQTHTHTHIYIYMRHIYLILIRILICPIGLLANSFALLQIPRMPETRLPKMTANFVSWFVCMMSLTSLIYCLSLLSLV